MTAAHNGGGEMGALKYGSVCSGIEAASVAWHPLGWAPAWFAEIEPFPSAVLAHHWPTVPNLGDFTAIRDKVAAGEVDAPDILVGGTPCQAFSVAGLRQSLDDKRGQLTLEFVRLANAIDSARSLRGKRPVTVVWENVPGVLNTPDNAFGCFLGALAGAEDEIFPGDRPGHGKSSRVWRWDRKAGKHFPVWPVRGVVSGPARTLAWRVLDAQWFGVAQRRRRVFVVASSGAIRPEQVLFEFDGVRRDSPPRREAGQGVTHDAGRRSGERSHWDGGPHQSLNQSNSIGGVGMSNQEIFSQGGAYLAPHPVAARMTAFGEYVDDGTGSTLKRRDYKDATDLIAQQKGFRGDFARTPHVAVGVREVSPTITGNYGKQQDSSDTSAGPMLVPVGMLAIRGREDGSTLEARYDGTSNAILTPSGGRAGMGVGAIHHGMQVRRLTPKECERLQGFPDGHTLIPWRGKGADDCPDGPRYKALGNSMAVPVMRWIGARIARQLEVQV